MNSSRSRYSSDEKWRDVSGANTPIRKSVDRRLFLTPQASNISSRRRRVLRTGEDGHSNHFSKRKSSIRNRRKSTGSLPKMKLSSNNLPILKVKLDDLPYMSPSLKKKRIRRRRRKKKRRNPRLIHSQRILALHHSERKEKLGYQFRQSSPYTKGSKAEEEARHFSGIRSPVIMRISMDELTSPINKKKKKSPQELLEEIDDDYERSWKRLVMMQENPDLVQFDS